MSDRRSAPSAPSRTGSVQNFDRQILASGTYEDRARGGHWPYIVIRWILTSELTVLVEVTKRNPDLLVSSDGHQLPRMVLPTDEQESHVMWRHVPLFSGGDDWSPSMGAAETAGLMRPTYYDIADEDHLHGLGDRVAFAIITEPGLADAICTAIEDGRVRHSPADKSMRLHHHGFTHTGECVAGLHFCDWGLDVVRRAARHYAPSLREVLGMPHEEGPLTFGLALEIIDQMTAQDGQRHCLISAVARCMEDAWCPIAQAAYESGADQVEAAS